jgi:hypothetical protein
MSIFASKKHDHDDSQANQKRDTRAGRNKNGSITTISANPGGRKAKRVILWALLVVGTLLLAWIIVKPAAPTQQETKTTLVNKDTALAGFAETFVNNYETYDPTNPDQTEESIKSFANTDLLARISVTFTRKQAVTQTHTIRIEHVTPTLALATVAYTITQTGPETTTDQYTTPKTLPAPPTLSVNRFILVPILHNTTSMTLNDLPAPATSQGQLETTLNIGDPISASNADETSLELLAQSWLQAFSKGDQQALSYLAKPGVTLPIPAIAFQASTSNTTTIIKRDTNEQPAQLRIEFETTDPVLKTIATNAYILDVTKLDRWVVTSTH